MSKKLLHGDSYEFERLVQSRYAKYLVIAKIKLPVGLRHIAEDVVQDTFLAVWWRGVKEDAVARRERDPIIDVDAYLNTVLSHRINRALRQFYSRRPQSLDALAKSDGEAESYDPVSWREGIPGQDRNVELSEELHRAIEQLTPDQQVVIRLRFVEDLCVTEIAARLEMPFGTVDSHLKRARLQLMEILSESSSEIAEEYSDRGKLIGIHPDDDEPIHLFLRSGKQRHYLSHNGQKVYIKRDDVVDGTLELDKAVTLLAETDSNDSAVRHV